jgi:hypothetical protein
MPMRKMCCQTIELGSSAVTYCVLDLGHEGEHEPERPMCYGCQLLSRWWKDRDARTAGNFYRPAEKQVP